MEDAPQEPERIARIPSRAYLECALTIGPEWRAIDAALRGGATMEAHQRRTRQDHAAFYAAAIQSLSKLDPQVVQRRCVGLIGTMEALSAEVTEGGMPLEVAVEDLVALLQKWLIEG